MKHWYQKNILSYSLWPLSLLWILAVWVKQKCYDRAWFKTIHFQIPVIVVGNLTVGGTGKTPFIIALAEQLQVWGFRPGIVSRGYGGSLKEETAFVNADSDPRIMGDEPVLLAKRLQCPIVVGRDRVKAVQTLLDASNCSIILSDDGLQHHALGRSMEIIIVDGQRQFGNGFCLPAGPLREPLQRLKTTPWIVYHTEDKSCAWRFSLKPQYFASLQDAGMSQPLNAFAQKAVDVFVGIGHPQRFLESLKKLGLQIKPHIFADHYAYQWNDLKAYQHHTLIMTEKDAVKCQTFSLTDAWFLKVDAVLSAQLTAALKQHCLEYKII